MQKGELFYRLYVELLKQNYKYMKNTYACNNYFYNKYYYKKSKDPNFTAEDL